MRVKKLVNNMECTIHTFEKIISKSILGRLLVIGILLFSPSIFATQVTSNCMGGVTWTGGLVPATTPTETKKFAIGSSGTYRPLALTLTIPGSPVVRAQVFKQNPNGSAQDPVATELLMYPAAGNLLFMKVYQNLWNYLEILHCTRIIQIHSIRAQP